MSLTDEVMAVENRVMARWQKFSARPPVAFLLRLNSNLSNDYVGLIAAGLAFYFLLAIFPALAAAVSLCGLFFKPSFVAEQMQAFSQFLPPQSFSIIFDQAQKLAASNKHALGFSVFFGIGLAVYSATKGVRALMGGLNIVLKQKEERKAVTLYLLSFGLTAGLTLYFLLAIACIAGVPIVLKLIWLPKLVANLLAYLRWPLLLVFALAGLEILYRFAPSRHSGVRWSIGAAVSTVLWLAGSSLFSLFVSHFGSYNQTYGSIGAVIILLTWFWMNGYLILLGAEIDSTLMQVKQGAPPVPERIKPPASAA